MPILPTSGMIKQRLSCSNTSTCIVSAENVFDPLVYGVAPFGCSIPGNKDQRRYRLRHSGRRNSQGQSLLIGNLQFAGSSQEMALQYWLEGLARSPSEILGGRTAPTCSRGYPGPQTIISHQYDNAPATIKVNLIRPSHISCRLRSGIRSD